MLLRKTRTVLACGLLGGAGVVGTRAAFSDTEAVGSNSFTVGSLDLTASPSSAVFNVTGMAPGDFAYGGITIGNGGSFSMDYSLATSATNTDSKDLRSALTAEVKVVAAACNSTTFTASVTTYAPEVTGIQNLVSGSARTLAAAASEVLCFKVGLPSGAANTLQGATTTATFTFTGS